MGHFSHCRMPGAGNRIVHCQTNCETPLTSVFKHSPGDNLPDNQRLLLEGVRCGSCGKIVEGKDDGMAKRTKKPNQEDAGVDRGAKAPPFVGRREEDARNVKVSRNREQNGSQNSRN